MALSMAELLFDLYWNQMQGPFRQSFEALHQALAQEEEEQTQLLALKGLVGSLVNNSHVHE